MWWTTPSPRAHRHSVLTKYRKFDNVKTNQVIKQGASSKHGAFPKVQQTSSPKMANLPQDSYFFIKRVLLESGSNAFWCPIFTVVLGSRERALWWIWRGNNLLFRTFLPTSCRLGSPYMRDSKLYPSPKGTAISGKCKKQLFFYNTHSGNFISNQHFFL